MRISRHERVQGATSGYQREYIVQPIYRELNIKDIASKDLNHAF